MAPRSIKFGSPSAQVVVSNSVDLYQEPVQSVIETWYLTSFRKLPSTHEYRFLYFLTFTMVVVAVAGGTGGLGRTVLDAIAKAGVHKAIVLSRTVSSPILSL